MGCRCHCAGTPSVGVGDPGFHCCRRATRSTGCAGGQRRKVSVGQRARFADGRKDLGRVSRGDCQRCEGAVRISRQSMRVGNRRSTGIRKRRARRPDIQEEGSGRSRFPVTARLRRGDEPRNRMPVPSHTGGSGRYPRGQEAARSRARVGAHVLAGGVRPLEDGLLHYWASVSLSGSDASSCTAGIARLHGMTDTA